MRLLGPARRHFNHAVRLFLYMRRVRDIPAQLFPPERTRAFLPVTCIAIHCDVTLTRVGL